MTDSAGLSGHYSVRKSPMTFRFILWLSLCGLVSGCLTAHPAQSQALPNLTRHTLSHGGLTRTYHLHRPSRLATTPAPIVFVLHGGGGAAHLTVFEAISRSSPRRRASPCIAEGFSPTARAHTGFISQSPLAPRHKAHTGLSSQYLRCRGMAWNAVLHPSGGRGLHHQWH